MYGKLAANSSLHGHRRRPRNVTVCHRPYLPTAGRGRGRQDSVDGVTAVLKCETVGCMALARVPDIKCKWSLLPSLLRFQHLHTKSCRRIPSHVPPFCSCLPLRCSVVPEGLAQPLSTTGSQGPCGAPCHTVASILQLVPHTRHARRPSKDDVPLKAAYGLNRLLGSTPSTPTLRPHACGAAPVAARHAGRRRARCAVNPASC
eukprot:145573-Chlamydomonas_euryale.AAC.17